MQLYNTRRKTAHRALQGHSLQSDPFNRPRYQTDTSGYNTACTTLEHITAPQHLQPIPDTSTTPDAVQVSTAAYYNKVYKGAGARRLLWIHSRQCSISHTMPARRGQLLPFVNRWQVLTRCQQYRPCAPAEGSASPPVQGQPGGLRSGAGSAIRARRVCLAPSTRRGSPAAAARRSARNHWRLPPQLFSGFRPIANKGQQ